MNFFVATLVSLAFIGGALVGTVAARSTGHASRPMPVVLPVVCAQQLQRCESELLKLRGDCMADQVSMRELEGCPGYEAFSLRCLEGGVP
jgi:hypothetical protein